MLRKLKWQLPGEPLSARRLRNIAIYNAAATWLQCFSRRPVISEVQVGFGDWAKWQWDGPSSEYSTLVFLTRNTSPKLHTLTSFVSHRRYIKPLQLTESLNKILITYSTKKRVILIGPLSSYVRRRCTMHRVQCPAQIGTLLYSVLCWLYRSSCILVAVFNP